MLSILPRTIRLVLERFSRSLGSSSLGTLRTMTVPLAPTLRIPPLLLRGPSGGQEAWDFSITSALRLRPAVPDPAAFPTVFSSVESHKRAFLNTAFSVLRPASLFAPWSSRPSAAAGRIPSDQSSLGSPVRVIVVLLFVTPMPVSRSRSASHAPFTGKTRARS